MTSLKQSPHLVQLDSLRGVAAVMVIFFHSCLIFNGIPSVKEISIICGSGPVLLFFVLSGYVLSASMFRSEKIALKTILAFYIRRFFRIYPAALVSILFGFVLSFCYQKITGSEYPALEFLLKKSQEVRSLTSFLNEITLRNTYSNSPLWTIQIELACSILMPFLLWSITQFPKANFPIAIILAVLITKAIGGPNWNYASYWLFAFYMGYQALRWKSFFELRLKGWWLWILPSSILLLCYFFGRGSLCMLFYSIFFSSLILSISIKSDFFFGFLKAKPLVSLGCISYSVYLIHMPVILIVWSSIHRFFPDFLNSMPQICSAILIFIITLIITIKISAVNYVIVEKPWNDLGHRLSTNWLKSCPLK